MRRFPYPIVVGEYALASHDEYNWWQRLWKRNFDFAALEKYLLRRFGEVHVRSRMKE